MMNKTSNISHYDIKLNEVKEVLYNSLLNNYGIKEILKLAHNYLKNAITICNSTYSIIENYPKSEYIELLDDKNGTLYLPLTNLKTMQKEKLMEKIFEAKSAFFFESKYYNYHMIFCPIRIRKSVVGYICVRDTNRNFTDLDIAIVDILSGILSLEMQKCDFYYGTYEAQSEYLLSDLIEKTIDNPEYFKERFNQLGHPLLSNFWFLIISSTDKKDYNSSKASYLQNQLHVIFPADLVAYYNRHLTVLISKNSNEPFSQLEKFKLNSFLHFNYFIGSLSYCCTNLLNLRQYYHQAYNLLNTPSVVEKASKSNQSIIYYENEVTDSLLLHCIDRHFLFAAIHPDILFLLEHDKKFNSELFLTLRTYLEQNRNSVKTSKALHIHKSTFFYRLNKITELLHLSLNNYERLYNYELSLHILDYLNLTDTNK
ncbi:carbohydrate diacid transcriptional activator CdaR [Clostridium ljungdahlii DSM 13528]|uniref:Carbohydrate diacid transcriptional activator CdaR n=3 Tax=Clostridium TaxID=1485 RepID=D8GPX8_CLOLD|nr:conserved hypothetical protein [Clostridium ljungdahlii DSM 13528]ALU35421.1 putative transcriptional regulator PucR family [Clostridium autoethanogenum DSM 10061]OAA87055.1 carbohydrate diacid transcriptional activator CdaR [Clostridium ljungdahlii DSM 13528]OVY49500.1 carbohydrate diacid transcriptional activator CdaR [Clostridium autoethanogenum]